MAVRSSCLVFTFGLKTFASNVCNASSTLDLPPSIWTINYRYWQKIFFIFCFNNSISMFHNSCSLHIKSYFLTNTFIIFPLLICTKNKRHSNHYPLHLLSFQQFLNSLFLFYKQQQIRFSANNPILCSDTLTRCTEPAFSPQATVKTLAQCYRASDAEHCGVINYKSQPWSFPKAFRPENLIFFKIIPYFLNMSTIFLNFL